MTDDRMMASLYWDGVMVELKFIFNSEDAAENFAGLTRDQIDAGHLCLDLHSPTRVSEH
jgi:hypothetical protein